MGVFATEARGRRSLTLRRFAAAVLGGLLLTLQTGAGGRAQDLDWDPEHTWVFAVGILEWQNSDLWPSFPAAMKNRSDAQLVRIFRDAGVPSEQIVYLKDSQATKTHIHRKFSALLDETDEGDLLVFYFAGHGYRDAETNQTWFAQYDAGKKDASGWSIKNVFRLIDDHFSGDRVLMMADCCHSGALYDEVKRRGKTDVAFAALTSSYAHNTSTGAWTFTNGLLSSFRGRPTIDYNVDSTIELHEAARYIAGEMAFVEGQMSMFASSSNFPTSTKLAAVSGKAAPKADAHCEAWSDGKWYKARVLQYDAASDRYQVHYLNYSTSYDEWLPAASVRGYTPKLYPVNSRVEAQDDEGKWYPAKVLQAWYGLHLVHYDDYDQTWDEWVGPKRIRPRK